MSFGCGRTPQQSFSAEVFVQIGPVNAVASARDFPIVALGGRGGQQAREPNKGHGDNPAVAQGYAPRLVAESDVKDPLIRRYRCRTRCQASRSRIRFESQSIGISRSS